MKKHVFPCLDVYEVERTRCYFTTRFPKFSLFREKTQWARKESKWRRSATSDFSPELLAQLVNVWNCRGFLVELLWEVEMMPELMSFSMIRRKSCRLWVMDVNRFVLLQELKTRIPNLLRQTLFVWRTLLQVSRLEMMPENFDHCCIDLIFNLLLMLHELFYVFSQS